MSIGISAPTASEGNQNARKEREYDTDNDVLCVGGTLDEVYTARPEGVTTRRGYLRLGITAQAGARNYSKRLRGQGKDDGLLKRRCTAIGGRAYSTEPHIEQQKHDPTSKGRQATVNHLQLRATQMQSLSAPAVMRASSGNSTRGHQSPPSAKKRLKQKLALAMLASGRHACVSLGANDPPSEAF